MTALILLTLVISLYVIVVINEIRFYKILYATERKKLLEESWTRIDHKTFVSYPIHDETHRHSLLILGDCMSLSTGASNASSRIHNRTREECHGKVKVTCYGIIGTTTRELTHRVDQWAMRADTVWLFIGPNDVKKIKLFTFARDIGALFKLIADTTHAKNIVWAVGNMSSVPAIPLLLKPLTFILQPLFSNIARAVAHKHGITIAEVMTGKKDDPFTLYPETFYAQDMFHPSDTGYEFIFQQLRQLSPELSR